MNGICLNCGDNFHTMVLTKLYCSVRCRKAFENRRARQRDGAARQPEAEKRTDVFYSVHNPSREKLEFIATAYERKLETRPSVFTGKMPAWSCPAGVSWLEMHGGGWIMALAEYKPAQQFEAVERQKVEGSAMDILTAVLGPYVPPPQLSPEEIEAAKRVGDAMLKGDVVELQRKKLGLPAPKTKLLSLEEQGQLDNSNAEAALVDQQIAAETVVRVETDAERLMRKRKLIEASLEPPDLSGLATEPVPLVKEEPEVTDL